MGDLAPLAGELRTKESIDSVVKGPTGTLMVDINFGEYDAISSEVMSVIARYDANVYYDYDDADIQIVAR